MIDPHSGVPAHRQLAAVLRDRVRSGEWPPGSLLPPHPRLQYEYAVSKATVKAAMAALRAEGLVDLDRGIGFRVREPVEAVQRVSVPRGAETRTRMPTPEERAEMGLADGVPVLVVTLSGRVRGVYPGDRTVVTHS